MFCDLVDSTPLSQRLDPEDLREVVRQYQETCGEVIHHFDGYIARYVGDGLLVYFGYPVAHEDDAQRAIRAGLGIVAELPQLNARLLPSVGVLQEMPLQVRIGIHTGLVVVGEMGGRDYREHMALGETPNVASRLQGIAQPDTLVVSSMTYRLIKGLFEFGELGPQRLKGVSSPVEVYRIVGESSVQSRFEVAVTTGLTPLVGREQEVGLLVECWEQVKEGMGQVVMLSGEAGIGKSRLVRVLRERVAGEPQARVECRCSPYYQNSAFYPVIEHLQRLLQFRREDSPQEKLSKLEGALEGYGFSLKEVAPLFASLLSLSLPDRYPSLNLTPQRQKQKTLEALLAWLLKEAERQPVRFVMEDLHWVDPSTLEFLSLLIDQVPTARILALLTFRPEFRPPWGPRSHVSQITLNRLARKQVEVMVEKVTGGKSLPAEVVQQVVTKTDGVPLFVEELTKMVLESGLLREGDGQYELTGPLPPVAIPTTLQDSLMARLDRLSTVKEVAQLGATLGREFTYELLQAVSPLDEATLQRELTGLVEAEFLYQRGLPPQARYIFKHALIQEAAYESLLKSKRQQVHKQIAQVLEERFPETATTQPELLAHHHAAANQKRQALIYAQKAGIMALQRSANVEAIEHVKQALNWLDAVEDERERAKAELALNGIFTPALMASQGYGDPALGATARRSLALIDFLGDDPQVFPTLWALTAYHHVRSDRHQARTLAQRYVHMAERAGNTSQLVTGLPILAQCVWIEGNFEEAKALLERAILLYNPEIHREHAVRYGMDSLSYIRMTLSQVLWALGSPDQALEQAQMAVKHAKQFNHANTIGLALLYVMMTYHQRRERDKVAEVGQEMHELCEQYGLVFNQSLGRLISNWALGEVETSRQIIATNQTTKLLIGMTYYRSLVAESEAARGRYDEALALLEECFRDAEKTGERYYLSQLYRLKGYFLLEQGSRAEEAAEACFRQAIAIAQEQKAKMHVLSATLALCKIWQRRNQTEEAHATLTKIYHEFSEGWTTPPLREAQNLLEQLGQ